MRVAPRAPEGVPVEYASAHGVYHNVGSISVMLFFVVLLEFGIVIFITINLITSLILKLLFKGTRQNRITYFFSKTDVAL